MAALEQLGTNDAFCQMTNGRHVRYRGDSSDKVLIEQKTWIGPSMFIVKENVLNLVARTTLWFTVHADRYINDYFN